MKRAIAVVLGCLALVVGGGVLMTRVAAEQARRDRSRFDAGCLRAFRESPDPQAVHRRYPDLPFAVRHLKDGSWVAVCAHTIHDDAPTFHEWDSAILWDSRRNAYHSRHHFCGGEGMDADLRALSDQSLPAFYKGAAPAFSLERLP